MIGVVFILITLVLIFIYFGQELLANTQIFKGICQTKYGHRRICKDPGTIYSRRMGEHGKSLRIRERTRG